MAHGMKREIVILVAEDSPSDLDAIHRALSKVLPDARLMSVESGKQAIAYLSGEGEFVDRERFPLPEIALADLKMPNGDGFMLLEWIRVHPQFRNLPVIIMSGAALPDD